MVYQTDDMAGSGAQTGCSCYASAPAAWVLLSPTAAGNNLGNCTAPRTSTCKATCWWAAPEA